MTTFQSLIYSIIHGLSQFLPIGNKAHLVFVPYLINWPTPSGVLLGTLVLGSVMAVLVYFRHDWASMISSFLQVLIFRKKPMTLDERLPLFLAITCLPMGVGHYYLQNLEWNFSLITQVLIYFALGLALWFLDSWGKKIKGTYDWKWLDASILGITQLVGLIPGGDPMSGMLIAASFLNYRREAAAKYIYFALTPLLVSQSITLLRDLSFQNAMPMGDVSWLSLGVALVVSFFAALLAIGGFMRHIQTKGMQQYVIYRSLLAVGTCVVFWVKSRG